MKDNTTDISKKLREYDDAFDFYMDRGQLPDSIPQGDLLGGFISQTVQDNPQLESQDPLWIEVLKDELMKFIEAMLRLFQPIEENHRQEKALIAAFAAGDIGQKRKLWSQVYRTLKYQYVKDWDKACDQQLQRMKELAIRRNKNNWEHRVKEWGLADYKQRKKVEKLVYSYPALAEIVRTMGREQPPKREDEMDNTIKRYLPLLPSPPKPAVEIDEVSNGNDLRHVLPVEMAIMADSQTEDFFYLKYATKRLQLFANKPKEQSQMKTEQTKEKKPRLEKGPIIVSLDTSGSMSGKRIQLAKTLLLQLLRMAKKQKRKCYLISFSVRAQTLDLSLPGSWRKLNDFLDNSFTGGTDGEEMLKDALRMLQTSNFSMADVLIISDFYFSVPQPKTRDKMNKERAKGTRFYGLKIHSGSNAYNSILDKIWSVQI